MMDRDIEQKLDDLSKQVSSLATEVKAMRDDDNQFVRISDLASYLTVVSFDARIERLTTEILARVTGTMQAMFNDAVKEATTIAIESYTETEEGKQWFREALAEDRAIARKERLEDLRKVATSIKVLALWIVPILTIINIAG